MSNFLFPLMKVLRRNERLYVYDAKSCFLTEVTEEQLSYIYNRHSSRSISKLLDTGVFSPGNATRLTPLEDEIANTVSYEFENYFPRRFSLDITEECTLRCKYCFYTNDDDTKRRHTFNHMSEETAYKAIDYYYSRYVSAVNKMPKGYFTSERNMLTPNLSWWGGEPLLQFELIKKTKTYIESLDWSSLGISSQDIQYSIVTNFTVVNDEIIDFIVNNGIHLSVSIDGGREEHDTNRVFADGSGSFDTVIKNIRCLIDKYPDYAKTYLTLQSVLANNVDENNIAEFINDTFKVNDTKQREIVYWSHNRQRVVGEFIPRALLNTDYSGILDGFIETLSNLKDKCKAELETFISSNRDVYYELLELSFIEESLCFDYPKVREICKTFSCPIGSDTMFISTNGDIHCCCKSDQSFPIGNVSTGLNPEKTAELYSKYFSQIEQQCRGCWAINLCKICPAFTCCDGKIELPKSHECEHIRSLAELSLSKYIVLSVEFEELYENISLYFQTRKKEFKIDSIPINLKTISHEKD